jgi:hypothetical protein
MDGSDVLLAVFQGGNLLAHAKEAICKNAPQKEVILGTRIRTRDLRMPCDDYSPPLYQLSYTEWMSMATSFKAIYYLYQVFTK